MLGYQTEQIFKAHERPNNPPSIFQQERTESYPNLSGSCYANGYLFILR